MKTTNRTNFEKLVSTETSGWLKKAQWREENESWLEKSELIALKILETIKIQKISQKELARTMGVSAQYVNKIVKGNENLSLETISKLEKALGVKLIEVIGFQSIINGQTSPYTTNVITNSVSFAEEI